MKDKVINDLLKRISDLEFEVEKQDKEIERLKEEYMILQNASDEVEENKDEEIERLNDEIISLSTENDVLKSTISDVKADIKYLLEYGEGNGYIRKKYIRGAIVE